jgi:outer membrane lipoprotein
MAFTACAESAHQTGQALFDKLVPPDLRQQIDRSVSFPELQAHPEQYEGKIVMLGGAVLSAKRLQDRTEIEILELPLTEGLVPTPDRLRSRGRFLAIKTEFLDPATVRTGSLITVIGKMIGISERHLDETVYRYPTLEILHLIDWEKRHLPYGYSRAMPYPYPGGYYGRFYGGYGGFYDPYWPYYGPYYPYYFGLPVVPAPPNPPPSRVPPQFKK